MGRRGVARRGRAETATEVFPREEVAAQSKGDVVRASRVRLACVLLAHRLGSELMSAKERPERLTGRAEVAGIGTELVQLVESVDGPESASGRV